MPIASAGLRRHLQISFHANEHGKIGTGSNDRLGQLCVMAMAVNPGRPLNTGSIYVSSSGRIDAEPHINQPAFVIPLVVFPSVAFFRPRAYPGAKRIIISGLHCDTLINIRIGGAAVDRVLEEPASGMRRKGAEISTGRCLDIYASRK